jgi:uncharacterized protein involved in exopolysaccharide biosynthesis
MDLRQLFSVLRAHALWIMLVTLSMIAAAIGFSVVASKTYTATTAVVVNFDGVETALPVAPSARGPIATQIDIASSHAVARKVVQRLGLHHNPEVRKRFLRAAHGIGQIDDWIASELLKDLAVRSLPESRVVEIRYSGADPRLAALIADAFAEAFIDMNLELHAEPARRSSAWREDQLNRLRLEMEQAQARFAAFRQENPGAMDDDVLAMQAQDVENAQRAYDIALQRYADVGANSHTNPTSVSILSKAVAPAQASNRTLTLNLAIGALLGLFVAVGVTLVREAISRRIRTETDVARDLGVLCLGVLDRAGV